MTTAPIPQKLVTKVEAFFAYLRQVDALSDRMLEEFRAEFHRVGSAQSLVPSMIERQIPMQDIAAGLSAALNIPLYPASQAPAVQSSASVDARGETKPGIVEVASDYVLCDNAICYMVNGFDAGKIRELMSSRRGQLGQVGIISRLDLIPLLSTTGQVETALSGHVADSPAAVSDQAKERFDTLLNRAAEMNASDVHIDPMPNGARIRFRIDGVLRDIETIDSDLCMTFGHLLMARGSGASGSITLEMIDRMFVHPLPANRSVKIRVAIAPVVVPSRVEAMPKITLRLLNNRIEALSLRNLGIPNNKDNPVLTRIFQLMERRYGLILVTGPTGSGKTTTLNAVLTDMLRSYPQRNRLTVEDPVELSLPGVNHVQANEKTISFARAIKGFLRHDPDEILVGEIRDKTVADDAMTAALTGHLVLSTVHTNSAVETITRLVHWGCDSYVISSTLKAATAQRLVRRVCPHCAEKVQWGALLSGQKIEASERANPTLRLRYETAREVYGKLSSFPKDDHDVLIANPMGCNSCSKTGYKGRCLVTEIMMVTPRIQHLIANKASIFDIRRQAMAEGYKELWHHGLELLASRQTTFDELSQQLGEREAWE